MSIIWPLQFNQWIGGYFNRILLQRYDIFISRLKNFVTEKLFTFVWAGKNPLKNTIIIWCINLTSSYLVTSFEHLDQKSHVWSQMINMYAYVLWTNYRCSLLIKLYYVLRKCMHFNTATCKWCILSIFRILLGHVKYILWLLNDWLLIIVMLFFYKT